MADETTLRLRIEGDTTGLVAGLAKGETELQKFATEAEKAAHSLEATGQTAAIAANKMEAAAAGGSVGFGKLAGAFTVAQVGANALLEVADKLTRSLAAPVTEILDAEQAAAMLRGTFGDLSAEMETVADLASQLGAQNAFFDDDALTQAAATLKLFGANADAIKQLLPYVNNLAIAFGVDVNDAAQMVGQALMGQTRALGKMVPEVRGANSQLEVLSALQASAARNATIAQERTNGLGGQLALLKRQLADAAQGWGQIMLPAMNAVLKFMNDWLLPGIGKVMGAIAAMGAALGALSGGAGLKDIMKIAGEAFGTTSEMFKGVQAKISTAPIVPVQAVAGLSLAGNFGAPGGTKAATAKDDAQAARDIQAKKDKDARQALEDRIEYEMRKRDEAFRKEDEAARSYDQAQRKFNEEAGKTFDEAAKAAEKIAKAFEEAQDRMLTGSINAASRFVSELIRNGGEGAGTSAAKAAIGLAGSLAGDVASFIPGISDRAVKVIDKVTGGLADVLNSLVDRIAKNGEEMKKAADSFQSSMQQLRASAEYNAQKAADAFKERFKEMQGYFESEQDRIAALLGPQEKAAAAFGAFGRQKGEAIVKAGGSENVFASYAGLSQIFRFLPEETVGKIKASLGGQLEEIRAGRQSGFVLTDELKKLVPALEAFDPGAVRDFLLALAEYNMPGKGGAAGPETINNGSSPDRPVYVFDVRPRETFAFAPSSYFFRNRGAATSRSVSSGTPLGLPKAAALKPGRLG